MTRIKRKNMCRWLYCLNWHIKDLLDEARTLPEWQADVLFERAAELTMLKNDVLCKLVSEGHAKIDKKHIIRRKTYYCVKLNDKISFHTAELERIEKAVRIYEQWKKNPNAAERKEAGADCLLHSK